MRDHAEHGDAETEGGVVHGFGDAVRQHLLLDSRGQTRRRDGREGLDQTRDGPDEADERRDVRQGPERCDAFFRSGLQLGELLAEGRIDLVGTFVCLRQARFDELQDRVVARVAQLDGAIDVAGDDELFDLDEELFGVDAVAVELEVRALNDDGQHDGGDDHVHHEERGVFPDGRPHPYFASTTFSRQHEQVTHPRGPFFLLTSDVLEAS